MAQQARKPVVKAEVQVIDEISAAEANGGVRVRAKAAKGHENDSRPIAGFFMRRRYEGDEFIITKPAQFSANWMEFVDEPPQAWLDAMKVNEARKAELMAKQKAEPSPAESLVFALSQVMARSQVLAPGQFDFANGMVRPGGVVPETPSPTVTPPTTETK